MIHTTPPIHPPEAHRPRTARRRTFAALAAIAGLAVMTPLLSTGQASGERMPSSTTYGMWADSVVPKLPADPDTSKVTVGVQFSASSNGYVSGVQFYRAATNLGPHVGRLWGPTGTLLASVLFPTATTVGWQTATFTQPVPVTKGQMYVASYTAPTGRYADDEQTLSSTKPVKVVALTAWRGVYTYGTTMPNMSWHNSNYYVDVLFSSTVATQQPNAPVPPTTAPAPVTVPATTTPPTTAPKPTVPATTVPATTVPATTVPATTVPATTVPPTTVPPTTVPPTTVPPTTTAPPVTTVPPTTAPPVTGGYPNASNTGVPAGVTLTAYTGPCTITANNTVIDAKTINCDLDIRAAGVVVTRSRITGSIATDENSTGYSFSISDSEINAGNRYATGIGAVNFTATRVHVYGGNRSIHCYNTCTVTDSYVHGQFTDTTGAAHESGIRMGQNATIRHNTIACDAPDVPPDAGCSAGLTGYGDFAPVQNNLVEDNWFKPTTGGYCSYGGSSTGKPFSGQTKNIVFRNNTYERGPGGKCGYWGAITSFDTSLPGNVWSGNHWDNGVTLAASN